MFRNDTTIFEVQGPFGVPVHVGTSLLLLPILFVSVQGTPQDLAQDLALVAILVGSILMHELGHAWGAQILGVEVRRIVLHGGGGACERDPARNDLETELIVAMGPIVNLVLWAVPSLVLQATPEGPLSWALGMLAWVNLYLALFNLLPVRPLDGGTLLELALRRVFAPDRARRLCGLVGVAVTVLWVPMMLASYVLCGLILFLLPSLRQNLAMARGTS